MGQSPDACSGHPTLLFMTCAMTNMPYTLMIMHCNTTHDHHTSLITIAVRATHQSRPSAAPWPCSRVLSLALRPLHQSASSSRC